MSSFKSVGSFLPPTLLGFFLTGVGHSGYSLWVIVTMPSAVGVPFFQELLPLQGWFRLWVLSMASQGFTFGLTRQKQTTPSQRRGRQENEIREGTDFARQQGVGRWEVKQTGKQVSEQCLVAFLCPVYLAR